MCHAGGMSAEWTAPEAGWYEFRPGQEPRKLTDAEVASATASTSTAVGGPGCPRCQSPRWVSVSLDGGWTRRAQCVPCGALHEPVIGPGYLSSRYGDPGATHPDYRQERTSG